jgi:hypothetical protein
MSDDRPTTAVVKFQKKYKQFNASERAGFPFAKAKAIILQGFAVLDDSEVTLGALGLTETGKDAGAPDLEEYSTKTHELNAAQCYELIPTVKTLEELQPLWEGEKAHPNHEGGRKGVLQAMQVRAQELKDEAEQDEGND